MLVTLDGISTLSSYRHPIKAPSAIFVTLFGMVMLSSIVQPENALNPILVTLLGITVVLHPEINVFVAVSIIQLLPFPELYLVFALSTMIVEIELQPRNGFVPILITLDGMLTLLKLQRSNALFPICVTLLKMFMLVNPLPSNAQFPIIFTLLGIVPKVLHPKINVCVDFSIIHLFELTELYCVLSLSIVMLVSELQFENTCVPILVTLAGMVTLIKSLHPLNEQLPILSTPSQIFTLVIFSDEA